MNVYFSVALSLVAIVVCGGAGAAVGLVVIRSLGVDGVMGALVAALVALVVATLLWAAGVAVLRALKVLK